MIVIRDSKTFSFNFDLRKDVEENLRDEIEFIIKSNEALTDYKKKRKWKIIVKISSWKQYSWTQKTAK